MLKCFLVRVPTTFSSSTGAGAAAPATTAAAGTSAAAAPPPSAPTGISRSMSLPSPIWIFNVPPGLGTRGYPEISGQARWGGFK